MVCFKVKWLVIGRFGVSSLLEPQNGAPNQKVSVFRKQYPTALTEKNQPKLTSLVRLSLFIGSMKSHIVCGRIGWVLIFFLKGEWLKLLFIHCKVCEQDT